MRDAVTLVADSIASSFLNVNVSMLLVILRYRGKQHGARCAVWGETDGRQTVADAVDRLAKTEDGSAQHFEANIRVEHVALNRVRRAEPAGLPRG